MMTKNLEFEIIIIALENIAVLLIIYRLRYKTPKEIPVLFHNGSNYDYHFIIKELAEESEG